MRGARRHRKCVWLEGNGLIRQGRCGDNFLGARFIVHGGWWSGGDFLVMTAGKSGILRKVSDLIPSSKIQLYRTALLIP